MVLPQLYPEASKTANRLVVITGQQEAVLKQSVLSFYSTPVIY
jgi:hypothetical protein